MRTIAIAGALAAALFAAGCQYPRDPEETLERVEGGTMYVGVIEEPPWVLLEEGEEPRGVEPTLIRQFARSSMPRSSGSRARRPS